MKKKVFALSMMIMGLTGASVVLAQEPANEPVATCATEECSSENCPNVDEIVVADEVFSVNPDSCCKKDGRKTKFDGKKVGKKDKAGKGKKDGKGKCGKKGKRGHDHGDAVAAQARLFKGLDLSEAQKTKLKELGEKRADDNKKLADEVAKKRAKLSQKYDEQLQKVLTPEQYAKYKDNLGKMRNGKGKKVNDRPVPGKKIQNDGVVGPIVKGPQPVPMTQEKK